MVKTRNNSVEDLLDSNVDSDDPGSPGTSLSGTDRKRRRGVIEKRRRDRINCSLAELKRLIPDPKHKTGTAKLEKAEILQLTVDFLQQLYKENHILSLEARSIELRRLGFKDCSVEVNRLLATFEGSQITVENLQTQLTSHLHKCEQQRELEAKNYLAHIAAITDAVMLQSRTDRHPNSALETSMSKKHESLNTQKCEKSRNQTTNIFQSFSGECTKTHKNVTHFNSSKSKTKNLNTLTHRKHDSNNLTNLYSNEAIQNNGIETTDASRIDFQLFPSNAKSFSYNLIDGNNNYYPYMHHHQHHTGHSYANENPYLTSTSGLVMNQSFPVTSFGSTATSTSSGFMLSGLFNQPTGPNESQSTSSPPFRSTPDELEQEISPHMSKPVSTASTELCLTSDAGLKSFSYHHQAFHVDDYTHATKHHRSFYNEHGKQPHLFSYVQSSPIKSDVHHYNFTNYASQSQLLANQYSHYSQHHPQIQDSDSWKKTNDSEQAMYPHQWSAQFGRHYEYSDYFLHSGGRNQNGMTNHSTDL